MDKAEAELAYDQSISFLDLPLNCLNQVLDKLSIEEKKMCALTSKQILSLIRSFWTKIVFLVETPTGQQPAMGIAEFPNLETVIVAQNSQAAAAWMAGEDWCENEQYCHAHHNLSRDARQALACLGSILNVVAACRSKEGGNKRKNLRLVLTLTGWRSATEIQDILYIPFATCKTSKDPGNGALYQSLMRIGSLALPRMMFEQMLESIQDSPGCSRSVSISRSNPFLWLVGNESPDSMRSTFHGGTLFDEVDAGSFAPDGALTNHIVRGVVNWCMHSNPRHKIEKYSKLRELRVNIPPCEAFGMELEQTFKQTIMPQLTHEHLPALKALHLTRPQETTFALTIPAAKLDLPGLTQLVLSGQVIIDSFKSLSHLTALHSLKLALSPYEEDADLHPQDVHHLSNLTNLASLTISDWRISKRQELAALQSLTELHLERFSAPLKFVKLSEPLLVRGATFDRSPTTQDWRYKEDSVFVRWALRKMNIMLPGVEVLHLGTLGLTGLAPDEITNVLELEQIAKAVDLHAAVLLGSSNTHMEYLQLNTVLGVLEQDLDRRCEAGGIALNRTFKDFSGGAAWQREVNFATDPSTDVLVAEFHYSLFGQRDTNCVHTVEAMHHAEKEKRQKDEDSSDEE